MFHADEHPGQRVAVRASEPENRRRAFTRVVLHAEHGPTGRAGRLYIGLGAANGFGHRVDDGSIGNHDLLYPNAGVLSRGKNPEPSFRVLVTICHPTTTEDTLRPVGVTRSRVLPGDGRALVARIEGVRAHD